MKKIIFLTAAILATVSVGYAMHLCIPPPPPSPEPSWLASWRIPDLEAGHVNLSGNFTTPSYQFIFRTWNNAQGVRGEARCTDMPAPTQSWEVAAVDNPGAPGSGHNCWCRMIYVYSPYPSQREPLLGRWWVARGTTGSWCSGGATQCANFCRQLANDSDFRPLFFVARPVQ